MKKIFTVLVVVMTIFAVTPAQAKTDLNLNSGIENKFVELTTGRVPAGVVVGIRTYLSIRSEPSVYGRELARISNGTRVGIHEGYGRNGFYYVSCWWGNNFITGYAHSSYISYSGGYFDLP